jgi:hypothetical protein
VPQTVPAEREGVPKTAVEPRSTTESGLDQGTAPAIPTASSEGGEVPDIYEFLKNAPPEG